MWGVTPNVQNFAAQFILLAGLGAVANARAMGWRLPSFFLGSAIIFKAPVGIALVAGFSFAQACRAAMARSLRPLIPIRQWPQCSAWSMRRSGLCRRFEPN